YSLGITFYRLLAGDVPFRAESAVELAYKNIHETPVPIERKVPGLDPRVTRLIASLLAKDPGQRPPDAGAVIRVLDEVIAKPMPAPAYHPMKPPTTVPPPRNVPPPTPIMRPTTPLPPLPPRPMERREAPAVPLVLFVVFLLLAAALAAAPAVRGPTPGLDGPFRSTDPGFPRRAGLLVGSALAYIAALVAFRRELAKSGAGGAVGLVLLLSLAGVYATAMAPARPAAKPLLLAAGAALSLYGFLIGCRRNLSEWLAWLGRALLVLGVASLYAFAARGGPIGPWPLLAGGIAAGLLGTYLITSADSDAGRRVLGLLLYLAGAGALFYFASAGDAPPPEWTARAAARFSSYPADLLSRETLAVATAAAAAGSAWALIEGIARYRRYYS
ncbi:MAG: hypothetical protein HYY17_04610, partial [Planctomycetes bacterium]|nr:hypothetical protein [Planctomycetota bacterium]